MKEFIEISPEQIPDNLFKLIDKDWMLVTAGTKQQCNMMTASWGGAGILWNLPVAFVFIRPQRYTDTFVQRHDQFSLCFFEETYRDVLNLCGAKSGRDIDKIKETGLTLREDDNGGIWFYESKLVLQCRKLYAGKLEEKNFLDTSLIKKNYAAGDFHHLYIARITRCLFSGVL